MQHVLKASILTRLLGVSVFAGRVEAATITIGGDSSQTFEIVWSRMVGTTELRAVGEFDVTVTDTYTEFAIRLANETALFNERIHSVGFNTNPNATSLSHVDAGQYFDYF